MQYACKRELGWVVTWSDGPVEYALFNNNEMCSLQRDESYSEHYVEWVPIISKRNRAMLTPICLEGEFAELPAPLAGRE